jgi:hypothetical protein
MSTEATENIRFQIPTEYAIALEIARNNGGLLLPNAPGKDSAKDFVIFVPVKYEVKCDYASKKSRNAFLEVHNCKLNKPSGLKATKADWWLLYTPGDAVIYRFKPAKMLDWLETKSGITLYKAAGDKNADGYIVPLLILDRLTFVTTIPFMG